MFHKKARKNAIALFVFFTMVFSIFAIVALAASGGVNNTYLNLSVSGSKGAFSGDTASGTNSYKLMTHSHDSFDSYSAIGSYISIEVYGESDSGLTPFKGEEFTAIRSSQVSGSYNGDFGWDMDRAGAVGFYNCGYCGFTDGLQVEVDM